MFGPISPYEKRYEVHEGHLPPGTFQFCWCRVLALLQMVGIGWVDYRMMPGIMKGSFGFLIGYVYIKGITCGNVDVLIWGLPMGIELMVTSPTKQSQRMAYRQESEKRWG